MEIKTIPFVDVIQEFDYDVDELEALKDFEAYVQMLYPDSVPLYRGVPKFNREYDIQSQTERRWIYGRVAPMECKIEYDQN